MYLKSVIRKLIMLVVFLTVFLGFFSFFNCKGYYLGVKGKISSISGQYYGHIVDFKDLGSGIYEISLNYGKGIKKGKLVAGGLEKDSNIFVDKNKLNLSNYTFDELKKIIYFGRYAGLSMGYFDTDKEDPYFVSIEMIDSWRCQKYL